MIDIFIVYLPEKHVAATILPNSACRSQSLPDARNQNLDKEHHFIEPMPRSSGSEDDMFRTVKFGGCKETLTIGSKVKLKPRNGETEFGTIKYFMSKVLSRHTGVNRTAGKTR